MFGISASKNGGELALVFDIGSASVGGALFEIQKSGIPKIIYSIREPLILEENVDADRLFALSLKSLEVVAAKISTAGMGAPHEVFCILSAPWYVSQTRIARLKQEIPFMFNAKIADELTKKEVELFEKEFFAKYVGSGSGVRSIELKNIKTLLNGYETSTPLNQKVSEVEMHLFIAMSAEEMVKGIEETIWKHFSHRKIIFSSFAMTCFAVVRDAYTHPENFLLVDVAGEMTDISMVKKNSLRESVSFPYGRNFLIRGAALDLQCSLSEAQSCISLFKDDHAAVDAKKTIAPTVDKLRSQWLQKFQESLANLSSDISVPATIYLAVDDDLALFFSDTIKKEQFSQYTLAESKFEVIFLNSELLNGLVTFGEGVMRDSFITISAIYINRFLTKK